MTNVISRSIAKDWGILYWSRMISKKVILTRGFNIQELVVKLQILLKSVTRFLEKSSPL